MSAKTTLYASPWALVVLAVAGAGIFLWNTINLRLDRDIFAQDRGEITTTPADVGLAYEEQTLTTADGVALHAWFIPGNLDAGIVMAPGYTDSMSVILKYAPFLHQAGYQLLLFDPRGQGQSAGKLYAFGAFEPLDIAAGMRYLRRVHNVEHVALFGHSNGATAALIAAAQHPYPEVFAVVADSPFANLALASRSPAFSDPFLDALFPLYAGVARARLGFDLFQRTNALAVIERVSHVLLIHGTADTTVTPQNSKLLFERAQEPKVLWLVDGAAHVRSFETDPKRYAERVVAFLDQFKP